MKKGDKFKRTCPITGRKDIYTYTGTKREVKGVLFEFFTNSNDETVFFYPSEVKSEFKKL